MKVCRRRSITTVVLQESVQRFCFPKKIGHARWSVPWSVTFFLPEKRLFCDALNSACSKIVHEHVGVGVIRCGDYSFLPGAMIVGVDLSRRLCSTTTRTRWRCLASILKGELVCVVSAEAMRERP